ncbi:MAG: putative toxin-antitoxin system toxin component, PIN family [Chloroflexi bacterium]|nr:putative toxin-antitoxin system toxin component, PIN family [Chloroflexota bacterium]MBU1661777.1 putative toxin-antitoxin system toxin component, PIN family [Chloroflexota bacterium]
MLRSTNDTNVWVSGINWKHGKPRQLLELALARAFTHVTSLEILFEITRVLRDYFGYSDEDAYEWYREIGELSEVVRPTMRLNVVKTDSTDNRFVECALEGRANYIVSGDHHLLDLGSYQDIQIVKVSDFLQKVIER